MSQTTSPKKPKTPPSSPSQPKRGLVKRRFNGKREILPVLPEASPEEGGKAVRNDARTLLACAAEHAEHYQLHKAQWKAQTGLSRDRFDAARKFLTTHRFVGLVRVSGGENLHGSVYVIDFNGQVDPSGLVMHHACVAGEHLNFCKHRKESRALICRKRSGCLNSTMPDLVSSDEEQGLPESVASDADPLDPYNDEPISEGKEESLTLCRGKGDSDFSLPETERQIDELTARLPEEQQHQVEQAMEEFTTNTTSPAVREDTPLPNEQEQQLLAQQHAHLLTLDPEDYIYSPPVTSEQEACSLRRAFGLWGIWKHSMHAEAALEAHAHREDRPVRFLLTALDLREYPRFHPGLAVLRLQEEPRCTDLELLGYKAVEHLKEGGRRRGEDAFDWLRHSIPGRMVLDCLAADDPLRLHEAEKLCRWLRRGILTVGDIARFWLLARKAPRPVPTVNLCETIRKIVRSDNEEDAIIVGCNLAWLRQRCGTDLVRLDRGYEAGAWLRALRPVDLNTQGWAPADLCGAFYRVQGATKADNTEAGHVTLLRVLLLQARVAGTTTADHIQQFLATVGFDLALYQRWLVESETGRRAFHAALQSGHVDEAAMLSATGLDALEHEARVRLLAAMCAAVRDGVREQGFQKMTMLGYAAF